MENKRTEEPVKAAEVLALSAAELAERLSVSVRHIRRMHSSGELPTPIHRGRCVRWSVAEIEAWLAASEKDRKTWNSKKKGER